MSTHKNVIPDIHFLVLNFPLFDLLQTSKLVSTSIQRLLVRTTKGYHSKRVSVLTQNTEGDVEFVQSVQFRGKRSWCFWQHQPVLSFTCQYIAVNIYKIIKFIFYKKIHVDNFSRASLKDVSLPEKKGRTFLVVSLTGDWMVLLESVNNRHFAFLSEC